MMPYPPLQPPTLQDTPPTAVSKVSSSEPPVKHLLNSPFSYLPTPFRQLQPPKSPLYRPAVLRSIERSTKRDNSVLSPPTSPAVPVSGAGNVHDNSNMQIRSVGGYGFFPASEDISGFEEQGLVSGPPGQAHWKPDADAPSCDAPMCVKNFSFVLRRHHCRRCGNVFCAEHTSRTVPLNQNCRFHLEGIPSRACDNCWNDYSRLLAAKRTGSVSSSVSSSSTLSNNTSPVLTMGIKGAGGAPPAPGGLLTSKVGSYVGSVPRDWSWSTF